MDIEAVEKVRCEEMPLSTQFSRSSSNQLLEDGDTTAILGGEDGIDFSLKHRHSHKSHNLTRRFWKWMIVISFLALVATLITTLGRLNSRKIWTDCGDSPEEARRRGCSFDMLSHAWQTAECFDRHVSETYSQAGNWEYYLDRSGKHSIPQNVVAKGETDVYLREGQHYVHCTYMWLQMHRAFNVLHHIDSHLDNYNHTLHCQHVLLENRDGDLLEVLGRIIYPSCRAV